MERLRDLTLELAAVLARALVAVVGGSCRLQIVRGGERLEEILAAREPVIFALWHERAFYMAHYVVRHILARGLPVAALVSRSRDGELAARLGRQWRVDVIRGSTSRGGSEGLRKLYRAVQRGRSCALLPDGPRGPAHRVQAGTVVLAQMTGVPVVPLAMAADRCWHLRSWDRMIVPKPFARVAVAVGEPHRVPRELSPQGLEDEGRRLERALDETVAAAVASLSSGGGGT